MPSEKQNFARWFMDTWEKTEGLICQADAARLLGVKPQSITSRINCGSLKTYEYEDENGKRHKYIRLNDIGLTKIKKG